MHLRALFDEEMRSSAVMAREALDRLLPPAEGPRGRLAAAMRYSALAGGKSFRFFLVRAGAALAGGSSAPGVARVGAALEMVHTYSLIHDDLPAMDDAATRRGQPSAHLAFDEATAILAGDALLTLAFHVLAAPATAADPAVRCRLIAELAEAAGEAGMVGGQMIDLSAERAGLDQAGIENLQALKTGALIRYGLRAGAIAVGADEALVQRLDEAASAMGLLFQIRDDILDVTQTAEQLGKPAGADADAEKATFVKILGLDGAQTEAERVAARAIAVLAPLGHEADALRGAVDFLLRREA